MIDCNFYGSIKLCEKYCENFKECTQYLDYPLKLKKAFEKQNNLVNEVINKTKELEQHQKRIDKIISELRLKKQEEMVKT